jgi:hypothetical protein
MGLTEWGGVRLPTMGLKSSDSTARVVPLRECPTERPLASTDVGAASMRTSHARSVVLGACLYCRWRSLHAHLTPSKRRVGRLPLLPLAQPPCAPTPTPLKRRVGRRRHSAVLSASYPRSHTDVVLGGAADSAILSEVSRSTSRVRCSRALKRRVGLQPCPARSQRALLDLA